MKIETVKVADLITPENNIRKHPEKQLEELTRSYKKFGQFRPVVVDENNYIWAGNGLVEALRKLGEETVEVYRYTGLSDEDKRKLMLADNKTFALGFDNLQAIDEVMKSLSDFDVPGYDESVLEQLYADVEQALDEIPGMGVVPSESIKAIENTVAKREAELEGAENVIPRSTVQPTNPTSEPSREPSKIEEYEPEKSTVRKYVICTKCGEKIWL